MEAELEKLITVGGRESGINVFNSTNPITYTSQPRTPIRKVATPIEGAFLLYDVLTPEECQQFIDLTEKMGYEEAMVDTHDGMVKMPERRNNERVLWRATADVWEPIWERVAPHIPNAINMCDTYCLNERLRFYRYDKEEMFGAHYDQCYMLEPWDRSLLTFIVYLTDDFEGGGTMFYPKLFEVRPVKGMACIFFHGEHERSPEHEGMVVTKGRKYVLRSDVMYRALNTEKF
ncbi:prolyl 4hydroxylase, alpha subunit [Acanthamoeba castellanii str. Neff]|uniref:Prolyl 4hydroxylase, alpha subunit n=1 Tax=Acanthamoeba castellanii (strain ATCC 30010 / Neff) TaxID=1257118 RepID=L8H8A8_ACACF|nr:prolyl 4hydroxylase, alpha subunit [Acanthamoeba castellanii str. Neff]ELR20691.1 prolyl 4hydroxylase, alpha subunit [Acanthamoeba castellanii str. Neff]